MGYALRAILTGNPYYFARSVGVSLLLCKRSWCSSIPVLSLLQLHTVKEGENVLTNQPMFFQVPTQPGRKVKIPGPFVPQIDDDKSKETRHLSPEQRAYSLSCEDVCSLTCLRAVFKGRTVILNAVSGAARGALVGPANRFLARSPRFALESICQATCAWRTNLRSWESRRSSSQVRRSSRH